MGYTAAIRTIGKAGEKYRRLLESMRRSRTPPDEIIIVLPEGYTPPEDRIGCEKFVFCQKGMIRQRMEALKYVKTEYVLFLDDDIEFAPDFPEKLLEPLENGEFDCSAGPLFSFFPKSKAGRIAGAVTGTVVPAVFRKDMYVRNLRTGGWSYNEFDPSEKKFYPTESFAWTCFMVRADAARATHIEDEEEWIGLNGYEYGDDRTFAFKLTAAGYRACIVSDALYIHNDAGTSISDELIRKTCSFCFNYIFWHKFIKDGKNRADSLLNRACFEYSSVMLFLYCVLKSARKRHYLKAYLNGRKTGREYVERTKKKRRTKNDEGKEENPDCLH